MRHLVKDLVSVVVPVYNTGASMLRECFDSVLKQDYAKKELIIVNDGSDSVETNEFCRGYAASHPELCRLIVKKNEGASVARNEGLLDAAGSMLMFLDSDDYLMENAIARLVFLMKKYEADAVIGEDEVRTGIPELIQLKGSTEILRALLENKEASFGWALWGKLFDTELMRYYYRPRPDIYYGEDLLVNADYFSNAGKAVIVNEKIYHYRRDNPESAMMQAKSVKKLTLIKMWQSMEQIYSNHGLEKEIRRIRANYYDSLLSGYLQCEYYHYDNYKSIMRDIKYELSDHLQDILHNPFVKGKIRYIIAVKCLWVFRLKRMLQEKRK